jgi:pimeloyl-ACP methyl ester carboxylesterase
MRAWRTGAALIALLLLLVVAGCGGGGQEASVRPATSEPSPVRLLGNCLGPQNARVLALPASGTQVDVGVLGDGGTGVVIAYERNGTVCTWLPLAHKLVARGYRVALFDYSGLDPGRDVGMVAAELRKEGVSRVFLLGGSLGGAAVLHGAVEITPPVAGVVNVAGGLPDGVAQARRLRVPLLLVAARDDTILVGLGAPPPRWMNQLYRAATHVPDRKVVLVPGYEHASELFGGSQARPVEDAVIAFLHSHGGP